MKNIHWRNIKDFRSELTQFFRYVANPNMSTPLTKELAREKY